MEFPNDPETVKFLIYESRRASALGNKWLRAEIPNHVASELCMKIGWAHAMSAAWLRAKLKGEFDKRKE
jgi:hypothetical protein